jgi:hypothetical protein
MSRRDRLGRTPTVEAYKLIRRAPDPESGSSRFKSGRGYTSPRSSKKLATLLKLVRPLILDYSLPRAGKIEDRRRR